MPAVVRSSDVAAPLGVGFGWLVALATIPGSLLIAVVGQGVGAVLGGCRWIGLSAPLDRQVWALVNQPALNFASEPRAIGYWLGSLAVPLLVGLGAVHLLPRPRTVAAELWSLHAAWGAIAVAVAWLPLLDPTDGHLARWLALGGLPPSLAWLAPITAAVAAFPPTLRLLALARAVRPHTGRGFRLALVGLHLAVPCAMWAGLAWWLRGAPAVTPMVAMLVPLAVAGAIAWFGYPAAFVHRLEPLSRGSWFRATVAAVLVATLLLAGGRALPAGRRAGLVWADPAPTNNVRPWIVTAPVWRPWSADDLEPVGHRIDGARNRSVIYALQAPSPL